MRAIDNGELDWLSGEARRSPRLRKNLNLHPAEQSVCQRLFNAIEPGSYVQPHRHLADEKDETLLFVRGRLGILTFDASGAVTASAVLAADEKIAVDIPHGEYHSAVALESGTIFMEAKAGPYRPVGADEKAPFAPEEGSPEAGEYLERLRAVFG